MHGGVAKIQARAFLRWAGGKTWLARQAGKLFGELSFKRYHEPFLGGGAFFFALSEVRQAYLSDKNDALIEVYRCIRDDHKRVIELMRPLKNTSEDYYRIRALEPVCSFERAAYFIYLNQTSFNGLYRVNLKGVYNVPYGNRTKNFLDERSLTEASKILTNCNINSCDFVDTLVNVQEGDLIFLDPPYTVSHNDNGFIKYNQSLFSLDDQLRLAEYIEEVKRIGAHYILTNAAHFRIHEIFDSGDACIELDRASLIGGKKAKRGSVKELLFTNFRLL